MVDFCFFSRKANFVIDFFVQSLYNLNDYCNRLRICGCGRHAVAHTGVTITNTATKSGGIKTCQIG